MKNYIGISRCIVNHWIYQDSEYFKAWFEILYRARWKEEDKTELIEGQLVTIKRGYFIFGRQGWSKRLKIGEQRLRTLINKLIADNMIEVIQKYNKFTIYNIINYEKYNLQANLQEGEEIQEVDSNTNLQTNLQLTHNQPTTNLQLTTKEERKDRGKKEKIDIIKDFTSNEILKETINDFVQMRKQLKKPMTDKAIKLMLNELNKLASDDETKIAILNQSIQNSWQSVYPLKDKTVAKNETKVIFKKESTFNNYTQRPYDGSDGKLSIGQIERKLLGWDDNES